METVPLVIVSLGIWAYIDATRQDGESAEEFALSIIVSTAGLLIFLYYLSGRRRW